MRWTLHKQTHSLLPVRHCIFMHSEKSLGKIESNRWLILVILQNTRKFLWISFIFDGSHSDNFCQIWTCSSRGNQCFDHGENRKNSRTKKISSAPHNNRPRATVNPTLHVTLRGECRYIAWKLEHVITRKPKIDRKWTNFALNCYPLWVIT